MLKFPLAPKQSQTAGDYASFYNLKPVHHMLPPASGVGGGYSLEWTIWGGSGVPFSGWRYIKR